MVLMPTWANRISGSSWFLKRLVEGNNFGGPVHSSASYAHLGYVPRQSYLLFGALYLNLLLFYFSNNILIYWENRKRV